MDEFQRLGNLLVHTKHRFRPCLSLSLHTSLDPFFNTAAKDLSHVPTTTNFPSRHRHFGDIGMDRFWRMAKQACVVEDWGLELGEDID